MNEQQNLNNLNQISGQPPIEAKKNKTGLVVTLIIGGFLFLIIVIIIIIFSIAIINRKNRIKQVGSNGASLVDNAKSSGTVDNSYSASNMQKNKNDVDYYFSFKLNNNAYNQGWKMEANNDPGLKKFTMQGSSCTATYASFNGNDGKNTDEVLKGMVESIKNFLNNKNSLLKVGTDEISFNTNKTGEKVYMKGLIYQYVGNDGVEYKIRYAAMANNKSTITAAEACKLTDWEDGRSNILNIRTQQEVVGL